MLQISNLEDGKSEWSINGTQIIIPTIDGDIISKESDKITTDAIVMNALDGGDQTILTNGLEHSLVIRNLFETDNKKSDLLVIQNSDFKLLPCNSDLKNPVTYTLSYVDADRSEIWESQRIKPDWCPNDKMIFEVKDVLNYDDSVQDSSKNWSDDLEKSNEQISLDVGSDLTSQVAKINGEILIEVGDAIREKKSDDLDKNAHFIVNYVVQNCEPISMIPNSGVAKPVENSKSESLISNELLVDTSIKESCHSPKAQIINSNSFDNSQDSIIYRPLVVVEEYDETVLTNNEISSNESKYETDIKSDVEKTPNKFTKDKSDKMTVRVSHSMPEKSLPLKKKAKMKRSVVSCPENVRIQDDKAVSQQKEKNLSKNTPVSNANHLDVSSSDSDEPLINRIRRKKSKLKSTKSTEVKMNKAEPKFSTHQLNKKKKEKMNNKVIKLKKSQNDTSSDFRKNVSNLGGKNFKSIYDLIEELKKLNIISKSVQQILCLGLEEMDVDILKEMNDKKEKNSAINSYSPQLKAFALVLHFKQPAAFNILSKVYKNGWPPLYIIKDWKRRLNSTPRPNFIGITKESVEEP